MLRNDRHASRVILLGGTVMILLVGGCGGVDAWADSFQAGILGAFQNGVGAIFTNIFFRNVEGL
ncbi:MAG: hypothetical protein ACPGXK_00925 [Phycisphaerae bacterium]